MALKNTNNAEDEKYIVWHSIAVNKDDSLGITCEVTAEISVYGSRYSFDNGDEPDIKKLVTLDNASFISLEEFLSGFNERVYDLLIEDQYEEYTQVDDN